MLDKRRFPILPLYIAIFTICLFLIGCISMWLIGEFSKNSFSFSEYKKFIPYKNNSVVDSTFLNNQISANDKSTLIDIQNFRFIINHNICNRTQPFLLMLIHSAPANLKKRNVIRETWGQQTFSIITLFLVGFSSYYKTELKEENLKYNDLIQGNFLDVYRNITYKHVMALKWVTYYCPNTKFVLKLDDDVFVHVSALVQYLQQEFLPRKIKKFILCDAILTSKVKRSWRSKWYVSPKEYPANDYPSYCAGWAILYSSEVVFHLYKEAQKEPFFWIDDVHVTGTLAKKINITLTSMRSMILSDYTMNMFLKDFNCKKKFLFGPPNLMENLIRALYNAVKIT